MVELPEKVEEAAVEILSDRVAGDDGGGGGRRR